MDTEQFSTAMDNVVGLRKCSWILCFFVTWEQGFYRTLIEDKQIRLTLSIIPRGTVLSMSKKRELQYTYKGPDRACLERAVDEVAQFVDSRYCGAPEASWRLFGFPLQGRSHHVERLPIHLPLEKNVIFTEGEEAQAVASALSRDSKLEAWFRLNSSADELPDAICTLIRSLRYPDVPRYFVWDAKNTSWRLRSKPLKEHLSMFSLHMAVYPLDEAWSFARAFFLALYVLSVCISSIILACLH